VETSKKSSSDAIALTVIKDQLADLFDCSVQTISALQRAGIISPLPDGRYSLREASRALVKHYRAGAARWNETKSPREASLIASTRLKQLNCELAEIKLAAEKGELLPKDAIKARWAENGNLFRTAILAIPAKLRGMLKLSPADFKRVERLCDATLLGLAGKVTDGSG